MEGYSFETVLVAFGLTLLAGLSTGIGAAMAFFTKKTNIYVLSGALGFSAGVMLYVSFIEIFQKARVPLMDEFGARPGYILTVLAFFGGIGVAALIDKFVPAAENPHEGYTVEDMQHKTHRHHLLRMGLFSALAIAIHNVPEGLVTFLSSLHDPKLGISIALAVALHNIPEGIAVSVPLYFATGNKKKAFLLAFLSGLAEPVGALVGYILLMPFLSTLVFGVLFAGVAGIMVYISLDELLPSAHKLGYHHITIYSLIAGMVVMASSLVLF